MLLVWNGVAIIWGGWWALQEGNWGGWWNWDPSEFFSLLPIYCVVYHLHNQLVSNTQYWNLRDKKINLLLIGNIYLLLQLGYSKTSHSFGLQSIFLDTNDMLFELYYGVLVVISIYGWQSKRFIVNQPLVMWIVSCALTFTAAVITFVNVQPILTTSLFSFKILWSAQLKLLVVISSLLFFWKPTNGRTLLSVFDNNIILIIIQTSAKKFYQKLHLLLLLYFLTVTLINTQISVEEESQTPITDFNLGDADASNMFQTWWFESVIIVHDYQTLNKLLDTTGLYSTFSGGVHLQNYINNTFDYGIWLMPILLF